MNLKKSMAYNELLNAKEALSRGMIKQAIECLKNADPSDETIKYLENGGDAEQALKFLEQKIDEKISILDYLKARSGIIKDQDEVNLLEKYLKLKRNPGLRGHITFNANSICSTA